MYCQSCLKASSFPSLHAQTVLSTEMSNKHPRQGIWGVTAKSLFPTLKIWSYQALRISQTLSSILGTMWWFHWSHGTKDSWNWWHRGDAAAAHMGSWLPCIRFSGSGMCWSSGLQHLPSKSRASYNSMTCCTATPSTNATISGEQREALLALIWVPWETWKKPVRSGPGHSQ